MADQPAPDPHLRDVLAVGSAGAHRLYGRERESSLLTELIDRAGNAAGGALVIRGEAGIGKSALLTAAAARAAEHGFRLLSAVGVQSEARLPFAGLHQLLRPVLDLAGRLPSRQRGALLASFGMAEAAAPEIFLIGLAALELIGEAAGGSPVLMAADDAQWLDQPTCAVLTFVARRLAAEPALLLVAVRDGLASPFDEAGLPELRLTGLTTAAAGELLAVRAADLDPAHREWLIEEAAGNPLALSELPDAVRADPAAALARRLPLTARLEQAFAAQGSGLPAATRSLLLTAAADEDGVLAEVLAAASTLAGERVTADMLEAAVAARLIEINGTRLVFRHPLVRSAIYQAASLPQRRAAHAALAEVLAGQRDRQVWHVAAAALAPDEQIAAALEDAAVRAGRRGAAGVAIDALTSAAELSENPVSRGKRLLRAAEMAFDSGRYRLGRLLLEAAEPLAMVPADRMRVSLIRENYGEAGWSGAAKIESIVEQAEQMRTIGHAGLAVRSLLAISLHCYWGNPSPQTRVMVVAAAERMPLARDEPALLGILALADPVAQGTLVNEQISRLVPDSADPEGMLLLGTAAMAVWAWDRALVFLDAAADGLRSHGKLGLLAQTLVSQAWTGVHLARKHLAVSAAEEAARLARETSQPRWAITAQLAHATVAAEQGNLEMAETMVRQAEAELLPSGRNPLLALAQFARGRAAMAQQRYVEGFEQLRRSLDPADPAYHPFSGTWGLADLVEAAVHIGHKADAEAYLTQLESLAATTSGSLLRAQAAYARPLLAGNQNAEALYQTALSHELTGWPGYRSRMLLRYGGWLRRQRRVAESRAPLRAARDSFDALGLAHLAEQARRELHAAGEASRRRTPDAWDQLTPQELQIARLAAGGLSNREIGQQLYISHRTVGAHLRQIFPKLGITSRSQLHAALQQASP
ncbi:MAG: AAA family ATPase [Streptosporangiaceae bacterium]|nr:AAA family ATPase [Streptosporangiaceae bacterium]